MAGGRWWVCLGAQQDGMPGERARAALGRDEHQGGTWWQGTGPLQDCRWGLGLEQEERVPELVTRLE